MLLAQCPACQAIFPSAFGKMVAGVTGQLTMSGNREPCPSCHHMANTADGIFTATENAIELLSAPEITRQMYADFLTLVKKQRAGEVSDTAFIKAAEAIDPKLGAVARLAQKHKGWAVLALLVIWLSNCVKVEMKLDANQLYNQVFGQAAFISEYMTTPETAPIPEPRQEQNPSEAKENAAPVDDEATHHRSEI